MTTAQMALSATKRRIRPRSMSGVLSAFDPKRTLRRRAATLRAARSRFLYRRAWHVRKRAKYAAVACEWAQHRPTMLAIVEELAGIRRHRFDRNSATLGASQGRRENGHPPSMSTRRASMNGHDADKTTNAEAAINRLSVTDDGGAQSALAAHARLRLE